MSESNSNVCIWNESRIRKIIEILFKTHNVDLDEFILKNALDKEHGVPNYFEILTAIILSQNTSDRNAIRAFNNLKTVLKEITHENIAIVDESVLKSAIRVAGLANRKSRILKELAVILQKNPHYLKDLERMDVKEARKRLLELPGVGLKTADVFLLMVLKKPTFPIDTHINRVVKRLGIASSSDGYEDVRMKIVNYLSNDIDSLAALHLLLIVHGRRICTARKPRCYHCTLSDLCCRNL